MGRFERTIREEAATIWDNLIRFAARCVIFVALVTVVLGVFFGVLYLASLRAGN